MGKQTGFLEYKRELPRGGRSPNASTIFSRSTSSSPKKKSDARRALHGLRRALL